MGVVGCGFSVAGGGAGGAEAGAGGAEVGVLAGPAADEAVRPGTATGSLTAGVRSWWWRRLWRWWLAAWRRTATMGVRAS